MRNLLCSWTIEVDYDGNFDAKAEEACDLAEGSVDEFIKSLQEFFERHNVKVVVKLAEEP